jgi:MSHA pilin protein MshD
MCRRADRAASFPARGFTLIEMIVFIVIVGVALAGVLSVLNITAARSADPVQPKQAMLVAESMLEEVLLKPYNNPMGGYAAACPGTCDRAQFDDIADYASYSSTGAYSLDNLTTAISGLGSYNVAVSVSTETSIQSAACRLVTVTVSIGTNSYPLSAYRCNYE